MMKKEVLGIYVVYTNLLGDDVIKDTCNFLLTKAAEEENCELNIENQGLLPVPELMKPLFCFQKKLRKPACILYNKAFHLNINEDLTHKLIENLTFILSVAYWILYSAFNKDVRAYYNDITLKKDMVVFCGGGLFQQFYMNMWAGVYSILKNCQKKKIPVYFNAIGFCKSNIFAEHLFYKYLINQSMVKAITTRDNERYLKQLVCDKKVAKQILDPGLWSDECYKIQKKDSDVIGIGVIRPKIFLDSGLNIKEREIENLYIGIINELEKRGYRWQLFCNGGGNDLVFAVQLLEKLNKSSEYLAPVPETTGELTELISGYKGIIAARLHACIIAGSLGIPAQGIVWNKKLLYYAKYIKCRGKYITPRKFKDTNIIINEFERILNAGVDIEHISILKNSSFSILKTMLKTILK